MVDISIDLEGLKTQAGSTEAAWDDQYALVNAS